MYSKYNIEAKVNCHLFDTSAASTTNQTSVSTNTYTDSFNQGFSRVENLSDVGNINISGAGQSRTNPIILLILLGLGLMAFAYVKKKA